MNSMERKLYECLSRIVTYYDDPRCGDRLPGLDLQARGAHENTMFGAARAALKEYEACREDANGISPESEEKDRNRTAAGTGSPNSAGNSAEAESETGTH